MSRCHLCPHRRPPVFPDGPIPCRLLFIGEGPSWEEDKQGRCFVGKTGIELTGTYFVIAGLVREEVYITNARWCSETDYANPTEEQAAACSGVHLGPLLAKVKPQIIVPMGAVACSLFGIGSLNQEHGIARGGEYGAWKGVVFPMFHPSTGLHSSSFMIPMMADFDRLRTLLTELDNL